MKLHILFAQRKETYAGEYAPEALVCWDEYAVEENPQGFDAECAEQRKRHGAYCEAMQVILVDVSGNKIRSLLIGPKEVAGTIE